MILTKLQYIRILLTKFKLYQSYSFSDILTIEKDFKILKSYKWTNYNNHKLESLFKNLQIVSYWIIARLN